MQKKIISKYLRAKIILSGSEPIKANKKFELFRPIKVTIKEIQSKNMVDELFYKQLNIIYSKLGDAVFDQELAVSFKDFSKEKNIRDCCYLIKGLLNYNKKNK